MTNRAQFLFPMTDLYGSDLQCFAHPPCAFKQKFSRTFQGVCNIVPFESLSDTVTENVMLSYIYLFIQCYEIGFKMSIHFVFY